MRTIGASSTGDRLWLAVAVDERPVESSPDSLTLPSGLESGHQLAAMLDDAERTLRSLQPTFVLILDPEPSNRLTFSQSRRRVVGETLLSLAAARLAIPCEYLGRATLRARLGLAKSGKLIDLVGSIVPDGFSRNWRGKRDLAALAALAAAQRDPDA